MNSARCLLSAVIIAKNEEEALPDCLKSVSFCDEVIVVDSGSTDRTVDIAKAAGARVFERHFDDFAAQKNYAVSMASGRWILSVDADERVSQDLKKEVLTLAQRDEHGPTAYRMPRINFIFGRRFHGWGFADDRPVRLFLKDKARFDGTVHETVRFEGAAGRLENPLFHYSTKDAKDYLQKLNLYTGLEPSRRIPPWKPWARFLQSYLLQGGILNGREGFIFAVLSGYYEFVRYAKFLEKPHPV